MSRNLVLFDIFIFTSQAITRSAVNTSLGSTELTVTSSKPDNKHIVHNVLFPLSL